MKILDCTLRDGGYYTDWDFDDYLVREYIRATNKLPIDYLEIGYRSLDQEGYLGEYFYCPDYIVDYFHSNSKCRLAVILNEKDVPSEEVNNILSHCVGKVDLVRIAVDPKNIIRAREVAGAVKKMGFQVAFNIMYLSKWNEIEGLFDSFLGIESDVDYLYLVDSYGSIYPDELFGIIQRVRNSTFCQLGFHGHNNLELAHVNTLTALENKVEIVDATMTGMGRGAGNLSTELLLTSLQSQDKISFDYNDLSRIIDAFSTLKEKYKWGTNLAYMVAGGYSIPQKEVMEWFTNRYFSFESIIGALAKKASKEVAQFDLPLFKPESSDNTETVLVIGGGKSVKNHIRGIKNLLKSNSSIAVVHSSAKNIDLFADVTNDQYLILVGNEALRLEQVLGDVMLFRGICILPPKTAQMGTLLPASLREKSFRLDNLEAPSEYYDARTALSLGVSKTLKVKNVYLIGYDGYVGMEITTKEKKLAEENEFLFRKYKPFFDEFTALTKTTYHSIDQDSLYKRLNILHK